jgi:putative ABC transport system permease protein
MIASTAGGLLGLWMASQVVIIYHRFYHFPSLPFRSHWPAILLAFAVSAATSLLGVIGAVCQAMKLSPAEAMRPEAPAEFKPSVLERFGLQKLVSPAFRTALRNLERKPWQAFFTALDRATAALDLAGKELARADALRKTGAIATQDWDTAEN